MVFSYAYYCDSMNNWIYYYYNIEIKDIHKIDNNYLFFDNYDNYYYLYVYDKDKTNIDYVIKNINIIKNNNTYFNILYANNNKILNRYNDNDYILLKINGILKEDIDIQDIIQNLKKMKVANKYINLEELWSKKIDYLEYQISELAKEKKEIINSFSFFVGLAENAISFLNINKVNFNNTSMSLTHNRIYYPNTSLNYYNPLNLIIDYSVRDLAEFIKEKVLLKKEIDDDIDYILKQNFTDDDIKIFYARLMFPSTYFDAIEDILLNNKDERILDKYIDSYKEYLLMLQDVYYKINKKNHILIPLWIKGVH